MTMPNYCDTGCTITGPNTEIERFKQTCLVTVPPKPGDLHGSNGIDFRRAEWEADQTIFHSDYWFRDGQHQLWIRSGWSPPVASLVKISALFPKLTFDVSASDEFYNFAIKGQIKAGVADLHKDVEAMNSYYDMMEQACKEANQK
jgi:hypothetical protein